MYASENEKSLTQIEEAEINKRMNEYYQQNENTMVDFHLLEKIDEPANEQERQAIQQEIAKIDYDMKSSDKSGISTRDLSPNAPTGTNNISHTYFASGDMILVHDGYCTYGYWRHAGLYDKYYDNFITATPSQGMTRQTWTKMHGYDEAIGITTYKYISGNGDVVTYARTLLSKQIPYSIQNANKSSINYMYCSLVAWKSWEQGTKGKTTTTIPVGGEYYTVNYLEIDNNQGTFCLPDDISVQNSSVTKRFAWSD
ncbi:hypothetical protein [Fervidicella metallireducens]|uniref:hypothetical protein n=1 Tax=Fervidicella metallireducens TaxID=655338 RepID=UPI0012695C2A|nr:hypothetical protein [Fervidicella metallireducens]